MTGRTEVGGKVKFISVGARMGWGVIYLEPIIGQVPYWVLGIVVSETHFNSNREYKVRY